MSIKPPGIRSRTRALVMQALYQASMTGDENPELLAQFKARDEYKRVDADMFQDLLAGVFKTRDLLEELIERFADRPRDQIDPVEASILLVGLAELSNSLDTPYRVVINEAVQLASRFGAEDGHKYVNALLDKAAADLRAAEYRVPRGQPAA